MKRISTAEARKQMAELINRAAYGKERFVVTRHGKELAAIVPLEDLSLLARLRRRLARGEIDEALDEMATEGSIPWDAVRAQLDL